MGADKRQFPRIKMPMTVEVTVPGEPPRLLNTRDISDGGVFLEKDQEPLPVSLGSVVTLKVNAALGGEPPPQITARVVRETEDGIGVAFESNDG
jgi:hypothetical protein